MCFFWDFFRFGESSYFSPLLKSIPNKGGGDRLMIGQDIQVRDGFIESLESRFLFLAADARSTLRLGLPVNSFFLGGLLGIKFSIKYRYQHWFSCNFSTHIGEN